MAVTNGWGQASVNNTNEYGKGAINNTIRWGKIYESSASGETNIGTATTPAYSNTKSVRFDGIDDYCETSSNYTLLDGESKATVSAWINLNGNSSTTYLCSIKESGVFNTTLSVRLQTSGTNVILRAYTQNFSSSNRGSVSLGTIEGDGLWHHLLICVDLSLTGNTELQVFLDGVSKGIVGRFQNTTFTSVGAELYVGHADGQGFVGGGIDEFAIWSGTDLRNDASTIYNSGVPNDLNNNGLTAPTTYYRMGDGDTFPTLQDTNGSADLTMTNMTSGNIITDVPT